MTGNNSLRIVPAMPESGVLRLSSDNAGPLFFSLFWGFSQFGAFLGLLMSLGQIVLEKKSDLNRLLALLFCEMAFLQGTILLLVSGAYLDWPRVAMIAFPLIGTTGPILYGIYIVSKNSESEAAYFWGLRKIDILLLSLIWILFLGAIAFLPETWLVLQIGNFLTNRNFQVGELLLLLCLSTLVFYLGMILKENRDLFHWEVLREEWTARILLFILAAAFGNMALGGTFLIFKSPFLLLSCSAMMGASLCLAYLIGHKRPAFFQTLQEVAEATRQKYARSLLSGVNREALRENLKQLMERDKLYRDEKLTLADLADELALSTHQVSELINQELGKNFSAFVNDYRIQEACELLKKEPDRSVLDIAFEVGFGTKSSFHRAFQKHTGQTPSEFRNSI